MENITLHNIIHIIEHSFTHTLIALPILYFIYLFLELLHSKHLMAYLTSKYAPIAASLLAVIPQCGVSIVGAGLHNEKRIKTGTLIAIFLATSDEFIPLVLATKSANQELLFIIFIKVIAAMFFATVLNNTLYKNETVVVEQEEIPCCHKHNIWKHALKHTVTISFVLFITYFLLETAFLLVDETVLSSILLKDSLLQPFVAALVGLIPGCYVSVLISQLFINGTLSLGSTVAGLCTGAGFGYIILLKGGRKKTVKILAIVYSIAALLGFTIQLFF